MTSSLAELVDAPVQVLALSETAAQQCLTALV